MRGEKWHKRNGECTRSIFGLTLRSWRKARGTQLKAVAADLGVSIETVSAWEAGAQFPSPENIDKIAAYTGFERRCLFCHMQPPCPNNLCPPESP